MGSFNISGFYSHLPITEGDEIGVFVCANIKDYQSSIPMEFIDKIIPLMCPVFAKYEDSLIISDVEESYTRAIFEEVIGKDFKTFLNNLNDKSGHQIIDDFFKTTPTKIEIPERYNEEEAKFFNECNVYYQELSERQNKSTYIILYEHRFVIDYLCQVRNRYIKQIEPKCRFENRYDELLKILKDNDLGGQSLNIFKFQKRFVKPYSFDISKCQNQTFDIALDMIVPMLLPDYIQHDDLSLSLYKNYDSLDYKKLRDDLLLILSISAGLYRMHGTYQPSMYAGQDIEGDEFIGLYKRMIEKMKPYTSGEDSK